MNFLKKNNHVISFLILLILFSCKRHHSDKLIVYYDNGMIQQKSAFYDSAKTVIHIFRYDSTGRIEAERFYSTILEEYIGTYTEYFDAKEIGCRGKETGFYINGNQHKEYEKYYDLKTGKLVFETHFVVVDTLEIDNSRMFYDEYGRVIKKKSYFFNVTSEFDTINLGQEYVMKFEAYCLDLEHACVTIGFDSLYRRNDLYTVECYKNTDSIFEYKESNNRPGKNTIRGQINFFTYKKNVKNKYKVFEKNMYFTKVFFVKDTILTATAPPVVRSVQ